MGVFRVKPLAACFFLFIGLGELGSYPQIVTEGDKI
jgi:hypothetical protein